MVRLAAVALLLLPLSPAAWSKPPAANPDKGRSFQLPRNSYNQFSPAGRIGRAEVAPNAHFGFGIFGMKTEKSYLQPVTGREIDAPKQRRAAVGFSLKF